jgi:hypothetical protein
MGNCVLDCEEGLKGMCDAGHHHQASRRAARGRTEAMVLKYDIGRHSGGGTQIAGQIVLERIGLNGLQHGKGGLDIPTLNCNE